MLSREIIDVMRLHLHELTEVLFKASPLCCTGDFYMDLGQGQGHEGHCGRMMIFFFSWGIKVKVWGSGGHGHSEIPILVHTVLELFQ